MLQHALVTPLRFQALAALDFVGSYHYENEEDKEDLGKGGRNFLRNFNVRLCITLAPSCLQHCSIFQLMGTGRGCFL
ncbi:hypothetical protein Nmel_002908 [Mimus melanotis]